MLTVPGLGCNDPPAWMCLDVLMSSRTEWSGLLIKLMLVGFRLQCSQHLLYMTLTLSNAVWNAVATSIVMPLHPLLSLCVSCVLLNYDFKNIKGLLFVPSPH